AIPVPAPEDRAHPQQEFLQMKGLGEVVVASRLEPAHPVHRIAARGEKQHRRVVALLAQCPAHGKAIDAGQHHIEHDERAVLPAGGSRVTRWKSRVPSPLRKPTPESRTESSTSPFRARALKAMLPPPWGVTAERAFSRMLRTTTSSASGSLTTLSPGSMSQEI